MCIEGLYEVRWSLQLKNPDEKIIPPGPCFSWKTKRWFTEYESSPGV